MTSRTVLLWNTHVWCRELEVEFEKFLNLDYPGSPEVWLVLDSKIPEVQTLVRKYEHCFTVDETEIFQHLHYPCLDRSGLLYHAHFIFLDFFLSHPEYEWYWFVEYDVRYTGEWGSLLRSFEAFDHDLITSHIRRMSQEPNMFWWSSFRHPSKTIQHEKYVRSFNPIYRMSNRALKFIHEAQKDGWQGLYEVSFPTLLLEAGFKILDFGGDGEFALPHLKNKFYTSGSTRDGVPSPFCTMHWRPSGSRTGIIRNKIYHPVKPKSMMEPFNERIMFCAQWVWNYICEKLIIRT
jgi:hypothetical protein